MSRVLVTGAAGYIGSVLCDVLMSVGHQVVCFDNGRRGLNALLPFLHHNRFEVVVGAVNAKRDVAAAMYASNKQPDIVIHLAGLVGLDICDQFPELSHQVNVLGTSEIDKARDNLGIPLILASTGSVYGKMGDEICTEDSPTNPVSNYAKQKLLSEKIVLETGNAIIFRLATLFGASPNFRSDLLPHSLLLLALREGEIDLYQGNHMRTFLHVRKAAEAMMNAVSVLLQSDQPAILRDNPIFNLGHGTGNVSKLWLATMIATITGCEVHRMDEDTRHDPDVRDYKVSYEKYFKYLNPSFDAIPLEDGLRRLAGVIEHVI